MCYKYGYETAVVLVALILVGMFCSRFLISTGVIGLSALWLFLSSKNELPKRWKRNVPAIAASGILGIYVLSGVNSEHTGDLLDMLKNKLPYLFIPISLLCVKPFGQKERVGLVVLFFGLMLLSGFYTLYHYIANRELMIEAYTRGQILPTVMHHVSYSVLLVYAVLLALSGLFQYYQKKNWSVFTALVLLLFFFIGLLHILATRTGLLLLYFGIPVYLLAWAIKNKNYKTAGFSFCLFMLTGLIGINTSQTWKSKIDYMRYDLGQLLDNKNTGNQLSDSRRILTDKLGWELFRKHPVAGVGVGDVPAELDRLYATRYPDFPVETRGYIHNQYLFVLAGAGLFLGLLFIAALAWPLGYYFKHGDILLGTAALLLALVLLWEPFLQYQYGNTLYILVLIFGVQVNRNDR